MNLKEFRSLLDTAASVRFWPEAEARGLSRLSQALKKIGSGQAATRISGMSPEHRAHLFTSLTGDIRPAIDGLGHLQTFADALAAKVAAKRALKAAIEILTDLAENGTPDLAAKSAGSTRREPKAAMRLSMETTDAFMSEDAISVVASKLRNSELTEQERSEILYALNKKLGGLTAEDIKEIARRVTGERYRSAKAAIVDLDRSTWNSIQSRQTNKRWGEFVAKQL